MKTLIISILFIFFSGFYNRDFSLWHETKLTEVPSSVNATYLRKYFSKIDIEEELYVQSEKIESYPLIKKFYQERQFRPFWTSDFLSVPLADTVIYFLSTVRNYGLEPFFYHSEVIEKLRSDLILETEKRRYRQMSFDFEILLTNSCFLLMSHLNRGVLKTDSLLKEGIFDSMNNNYPAILNKLNEGKGFNEFQKLQPKIYEYVHLQHSLEEYLKNVTLKKDSISIPDPKKDSIVCYSRIQDILIAGRYLNDSVEKVNTRFNDALKKFQRAHGLQQDAIIGPDTRKALSMNSYDHYLLAAINMERLKWESFVDSAYVMINVPSYELRIYENNSLKKRHKVIVGTPYTQTPDITSEIFQVITYPIWTVPRSISVWEILPKIKRDPNFLNRKTYQYFDRNNNEVNPFKIDWESVTVNNFRYTIKQDRGGSNPLGVVKFNFKSPFAIYMHDTSAKKLFDKELRAFSHGCIRLQYPLEFLEYLLSRENNQKIKKSLYKHLEKKKGGGFNLSNPLKLYVRYYTCQADSSMKLRFFKDVYHKDSVLKRRFMIGYENDIQMYPLLNANNANYN